MIQSLFACNFTSFFVAYIVWQFAKLNIIKSGQCMFYVFFFHYFAVTGSELAIE